MEALLGAGQDLLAGGKTFWESGSTEDPHTDLLN